MGSPLGMFVTTYFEESFVRDRLPTCEHFYNLYHPSDCIAYRLEPLVRPYIYESDEEESKAFPKFKRNTTFTDNMPD